MNHLALSQALRVVLKEPLNKMSSVLPLMEFAAFKQVFTSIHVGNTHQGRD